MDRDLPSAPKELTEDETAALEIGRIYLKAQRQAGATIAEAERRAREWLAEYVAANSNQHHDELDAETLGNVEVPVAVDAPTEVSAGSHIATTRTIAEVDADLFLARVVEIEQSLRVSQGTFRRLIAKYTADTKVDTDQPAAEEMGEIAQRPVAIADPVAPARDPSQEPPLTTPPPDQPPATNAGWAAPVPTTRLIDHSTVPGSEMITGPTSGPTQNEVTPSPPSTPAANSKQLPSQTWLLNLITAAVVLIVTLLVLLVTGAL